MRIGPQRKLGRLRSVLAKRGFRDLVLDLDEEIEKREEQVEAMRAERNLDSGD